MVRSRSPYQWRPGSNVLKKNLVRLAEVWLDEFKEIYYERINNKLGDIGDLTQRKLLRNNLQCKRFQQRAEGLMKFWKIRLFISVSPGIWKTFSPNCLFQARLSIRDH